ncbi:hypothetical protein Nos7524_5391 [Nostoc sp. PCC 7524]|jgi:uncharacterized protein (DUF2141 family)|uniref:DUF2141 domain-containing protein n=1 Tax=Nostoc sp. (strain ATCC 29411 / PCC 7524) TaxID=28072 RepID=UPI00029F3692|nr:DUF2141 domain-containing protein [Nostoc sp. PCC 7524]AFY51109.1 hypothetical protein Nos7524_5391 [Nostoc sp. PCC 7524]
MWKISRLRHVFLASLLSLTCIRPLNAEPTAKLTVVVNGIRHQQGQICFRVYDSEKGFPLSDTSEVQSGCTRITGKTITKHFYGLKRGTYAVAIVDDQNGNQKLDSDFFGIPKEGFGISNNPRVSIQTGTPKFNKSSFAVSKNTTIDITLKYSLDP